jgi:hypothetical protein
MKFKLVEYPYGREIGFNQDTVWFIQGTDDNKTWYNYVWNYTTGSPAIIFEKETCSRVCPPISACLTIETANDVFDKITNYYREQLKEKPIRTLREVEI